MVSGDRLDGRLAVVSPRVVVPRAVRASAVPASFDPMTSPTISVVVVAYGMERELPRTLRTLDPSYQRGIHATDYEVIVVDNGSPSPVADRPTEVAPNVRFLRIDDAPASPARAANAGIAAARGSQIGLVVDGARMCSPGLLASAVRGRRVSELAVITATAWHLGSVPHMRAAEAGYDQNTEDELLTGVDWEGDGYSLFSIATFAGSSWRGIFGPMGESSSLFLTPAQWQELGGLDERFDLPGGGLVNHDLYQRACELEGVELVQLLGEGTFHQFHGGAATSRQLTWPEMHEQYRAIKGRRYVPPSNQPIYLGAVPKPALVHLERSARLAMDGYPKAPPS